ncbi:MAG: hypothetical protein ACLFOY_01025 [Desulfatibacillaceae bacterium]
MLKLERIVVLIILVGILYHYSETVQRQVDTLSAAVPLVQTYVEMTRYTGALESYVAKNSHMPHDLTEWLRGTFSSMTGKDPAADFFGTLYMPDRGEGIHWLRSCGRDTSCRTEDDLVMAISVD